jgi:hypothetical protein
LGGVSELLVVGVVDDVVDVVVGDVDGDVVGKVTVVDIGEV